MDYMERGGRLTWSVGPALSLCCLCGVVSEEQAEVIGRPSERAGATESCGRLML